MKLKSTAHFPHGHPIFTRVFPFKLKYLGFSCKNEEPTIRRFSTRPFRSKDSSSGRSYNQNSDFSRGHRGGTNPAKSLIEDEAELSDWVSELKSDSVRTRLPSDDDNSDSSNFNRDRSRFKSRERGMNRENRESFGSMRNQRGGRNGFSSLKRGRDSDSFNSEPFSRSSRGRGSGVVGKRQFDSNFDEKHDRFSRQGTRRVDKDLEEEVYGSSRQKRGSRSGSSLTRGGRSSGLSYERNRGSERLMGVGKSMGRRVPLATDDESEGDDEDEEEESKMPTIKDLLSDEGSDEGEDEVEEEEDDDDDKNAVSSMFKFKSINEDGAGVSPRSLPGKSDSYLSETRFDQCSVSPLSLKGIKDAGYEKMTVVQEATLPVILKGKDVLAKAKTGTGKTVAFLLPSIEVVIKSPAIGRDQKRPPIYVLVICPTRELACQAAAEANTLLKYHPEIGVQVVIGGTRLALEQKRMQANPCQILVATPGRLKDHIENTAGFATRLMGVKVLVLDEADHLLDMGFRKDIERIISAVPKQRQTLLFSATVPDEVRQICHIALKRDHEFINTVEEGSEETHSQVRQTHLVAPLDKQLPLLYVLLKDHIADDVDYKVLIFCTTAMVTRLVAGLLGELKLNVREIHSRKSQSYRTKVSDEFRKSKGLILVTSDVSARGVDYPDVTLVIQMGLPADRQQYIHRLGRTGRKGKEGEGILLLAPWEEFFLSTIKDLPITSGSVPSVDPETRKKVERALSHVDMKSKEAAYQAWLGYYNSNSKVGRDKHRLVELANEFSRCMGLDNPPAIPKLILGKMGLRNVPGLRSK